MLLCFGVGLLVYLHKRAIGPIPTQEKGIFGILDPHLTWQKQGTGNGHLGHAAQRPWATARRPVAITRHPGASSVVPRVRKG
jgi:hypothetical protein